mmetsp:Transcript_15957/g.31893  ORF Transcript_15957/g.31893 Transcript_15957/m.31893 type:complete len:202 (+) Transcript_15957:1-606(+)
MMGTFTQAELDAISSKWEVRDKVVKDGEANCRPGTKVMVRKCMQHLRGYRRFCGVGHLTRPVQETPGRWYVKFPGTEETFLSTGRNGLYELTYVPEDPRRNETWRRGSITDALISPMTRGMHTVVLEGETLQKQFDNAMSAFRTKLILARLSPRHAPEGGPMDPTFSQTQALMDTEGVPSTTTTPKAGTRRILPPPRPTFS